MLSTRLHVELHTCAMATLKSSHLEENWTNSAILSPTGLTFQVSMLDVDQASDCLLEFKQWPLITDRNYPIAVPFILLYAYTKTGENSDNQKMLAGFCFVPSGGLRTSGNQFLSSLQDGCMLSSRALTNVMCRSLCSLFRPNSFL
jgi:hypothetical protein